MGGKAESLGGSASAAGALYASQGLSGSGGSSGNLAGLVASYGTPTATRTFDTAMQCAAITVAPDRSCVAIAGKEGLYFPSMT